MPYMRISPQYMQEYGDGRSVYLGPSTPVRYGVMSTRVDPDTGQIDLTGYREEQGAFPVLPGFFFSWLLKGIWNFLTGKLMKWLFKIDPKENPLRLDYHMGYVERRYEKSQLEGSRYGNGKGYNGNGNGWENDLAKDLYPLD